MDEKSTGRAVAHTRKDSDGSTAKAHDLEKHLADVAQLAQQFAAAFGNGDWGWLAGLWHDLGKYKPAFQKYLLEHGDDEGHETDSVGTTDKQHAIVGALHSMDRFQRAYGKETGEVWGRVLAYLIAGHHTGLPDWDQIGEGAALEPKLRDRAHLSDALLGRPPQGILDAPLPETLCQTDEPSRQLHQWVRMLFSCLVDADFLDTETYMNELQAYERNLSLPSLPELKSRFDTYMAGKTATAEPGPVNSLRQEILAQCREHAVWEPGVFSLAVPTGGGKTLSGMAFALEHALKHEKRRIIVAIPYTSIIEQTALQYRQVFGDEAVLEHHSNLDPDRETRHAKLASENWEAPIIVTTNVQLFESLFAAKTSACRKLHNIADSVIILDEAQTLPPGYLEPIVSSIQGLCQLFGCSVVLSTATQPVLDKRLQVGKTILHGFDPSTVRPLMKNPTELSRRLRRVEIVPFHGGERASWDELAEELRSEDQVLSIVNTRKDCRDLFDLMPAGTIHLSALMCPEHRSEAIATVKGMLKRRETIRVVSTQLVEAGVDFDFPVVYRALAGFDSIAQAAGRCNREGTLNKEGRLGRTVVFKPLKDAPPGLLRKGQDAGDEVLRLHPELVATLDPEIFSHYFQAFYRSVVSFDERGIMGLLAGPDAVDAKIQFRTAASKFSLIENAGQVSVVVWYGLGKSLVDELERAGPSRRLLRRLQRFTVTIPERVKDLLVVAGYLRPAQGLDRVWTQTEMVAQGKEINLYDPVFGLKLEGPQLGALDFQA